MADATELLAFLRRAETARDGVAAYRTIIGHHEDTLAKPITSMSVDEVLSNQISWGRKWKSSAAGAYQIIRKTLAGLKAALGLSGSEKFAPDLQDRMAMELLRQRGWEKAVAGSLSAEAFALALAKEWASMPVLKDTKGATRQVKRGQSFYAGDGLNKALVSANELEAVLARALNKAAPVDAASTQEFPQKGARDNAQVAQIQTRLRELGYSEAGSIDGDFGDATEAAIMIFRRDNGLLVNGRIDKELLAALMTAKPRKIADDRANAPPSVVREQAPEVKASFTSKVWSGVMALASAAGGGITYLVNNFSDARNSVKPIADFFGGIPIWAYAGLIAIGFFTVYWMSGRAEKKGVEAYQAGERR